MYRDKCTRIIRTEVRLLWQAEGKQRGYQEHTSFFPLFLVCPFLSIHLFIHSFIYQFSWSVSLPFCSSHGPKAWD